MTVKTKEQVEEEFSATKFGRNRISRAEERKLVVAEVEKLGTTSQLRIGENKMAMKHLNLTLEEIKQHNAYADGYNNGTKEQSERILEAITNQNNNTV